MALPSQHGQVGSIVPGTIPNWTKPNIDPNLKIQSSTGNSTGGANYNPNPGLLQSIKNTATTLFTNPSALGKSTPGQVATGMYIPQNTTPGILSTSVANAQDTNQNINQNTNTSGTGTNNNTPNNTPTAKTADQLREEQKKVLTDQISDLNKKLKIQQEGQANGTIDFNGNAITQSTPAPTPQTGYNPQYNAQNIPTPGTVASQLANVASTPSPEIEKAKQAIVDLKNEYAQKGVNIDNTAGFLTQATGLQGQLQHQYQTALEAATGNLNAAMAQQGQSITALTNAGSQVAPQFPGYNQQVYVPGQGFVNQGGGTGALSQLPQQAQQAIQSYAEQVKNGQMTRQDAESRLSAYGVAGTNALNESLGTGFNTNASNASAGTTAQGQQIQTAAKATNDALDSLNSLFSNLNPVQTQGIPATNSLANWIGTQLGDKALSSYRTALSDARSQLIGVLNSSGGTPTGNEATALQYLPDNMTKAQFDTNVGTAQNPGIVRTLVQQKVSRFTGSGSQGGPTNNQGTSSGIQYNPDGTLKAVSF